MEFLTASDPNLYLALKAEGFDLPLNCVSIELTTSVDGLYQLEMTINLTAEDIASIGRALVAVSNESMKPRIP